MNGRRFAVLATALAAMGILSGLATAQNPSSQSPPSTTAINPPTVTQTVQQETTTTTPTVTQPTTGPTPPSGPPNNSVLPGTQSGGQGPTTQGGQPAAQTGGGTAPGLFESARGSLPFTGFEAGMVLFLGAVAVATGVALRRRARPERS